uniref:Uncharacterized protein n=1 Tax=Ditylenchus dipsaci TaxID=166011 RepID=A0A915EAE7_9BILA
VEFPVSLVKHDRVIYPTSLSVIYSMPNLSTGIGLPLKSDYEIQ